MWLVFVAFHTRSCRSAKTYPLPAKFWKSPVPGRVGASGRVLGGELL